MSFVSNGISENATSRPWDTSTLARENIIDLNSTTKEPYERPFSDNAIIASAVILLTFLVLGLVGNILTIVVITTSPKLKNIFMCFIVSLCVSDLWSAMISWLFLYRRTWGFDVWAPLPAVFCRFYWASDLMTNYVTAWHILSFALLRYLSCQFPIRFAKIKQRHAKMLIVIIWVLSFLVGFIPFFIFFDARYIDRLSDQPNARWPACTITLEWLDQYTTYQKFAFPIFLYAPTIIMVIISILLSISVWKRSTMLKLAKNGEKKRRKERQAVLQVFLIVASYLIGYIPFTAYEFWAVQPRPNTRYTRRLDYWFGMTEYYFLRFSECLNPVFYNLGSSKIRHYTVKFLRNRLCNCWTTESQASASSTSAATTNKPSQQTNAAFSTDNELRD